MPKLEESLAEVLAFADTGKGYDTLPTGARDRWLHNAREAIRVLGLTGVEVSHENLSAMTARLFKSGEDTDAIKGAFINPPTLVTDITRAAFTASGGQSAPLSSVYLASTGPTHYPGEETPMSDQPDDREEGGPDYVVVVRLKKSGVTIYECSLCGAAVTGRLTHTQDHRFEAARRLHAEVVGQAADTVETLNEEVEQSLQEAIGLVNSLTERLSTQLGEHAQELAEAYSLAADADLKAQEAREATEALRGVLDAFEYHSTENERVTRDFLNELGEALDLGHDLALAKDPRGLAVTRALQLREGLERINNLWEEPKVEGGWATAEDFSLAVEIALWTLYPERTCVHCGQLFRWHVKGCPEKEASGE